MAESSIHGPLIIAHRGASADAPENTVESFALAWEQGADGIETDLHLTRDGYLVCLHDADTERASGVRHVVRRTDLATLRHLPIGYQVGSVRKPARIPVLDEVLARIPPEKSIFLEVKCGPEALPVLDEAITASTLQPDQITVISFHPQVIREWKQSHPTMEALWLVSPEQAGSPLSSSCIDRWIEELQEIGADGLSSNQAVPIDAAMVATLRAAGFSTHVWTVDDAVRAVTLSQAGVRSVTTNTPARIVHALREQPLRDSANFP